MKTVKLMNFDHFNEKINVTEWDDVQDKWSILYGDWAQDVEVFFKSLNIKDYVAIQSNEVNAITFYKETTKSVYYYTQGFKMYEKPFPIAFYSPLYGNAMAIIPRQVFQTLEYDLKQGKYRAAIHNKNFGL